MENESCIDLENQEITECHSNGKTNVKTEIDCQDTLMHYQFLKECLEKNRIQEEEEKKTRKNENAKITLQMIIFVRQFLQVKKENQNIKSLMSKILADIQNCQEAVLQQI